MKKGVIFLIVIALVVLAFLFVPNKKTQVPADVQVSNGDEMMIQEEGQSTVDTTTDMSTEFENVQVEELGRIAQ